MPVVSYNNIILVLLMAEIMLSAFHCCDSDLCACVFVCLRVHA